MTVALTTFSGAILYHVHSENRSGKNVGYEYKRAALAEFADGHTPGAADEICVCERAAKVTETVDDQNVPRPGGCGCAIGWQTAAKHETIREDAESRTTALRA
jgi:hypothetical protein